MLVSGRNASCLRKQCWSCSFHLFRSLSFLSVLEYQVSIGSLSLGDRAAEPVFHRYVDPVFQTSDAAQRIRMRQGRSWSLILQLDLYMTYDYDLYTMYIADDCSGLRWIGQGIYTFPRLQHKTGPWCNYQMYSSQDAGFGLHSSSFGPCSMSQHVTWFKLRTTLLLIFSGQPLSGLW